MRLYSDEDNRLCSLTGTVKSTRKTTTENSVFFQVSIINEKVHKKPVNMDIVKLCEKCKKRRSQRSEDNRISTFLSNSAAADFVLGYSLNGLKN